MTISLLAFFAFFAAAPVALLLAQLLVVILRRIVKNRVERKTITQPKPKLWARSAHGGERAIEALQSTRGGT